MDPVQVLPPELLHFVISQMTHQEMVGKLRVSKLWSITLSPYLTAEVDFRESRGRDVKPEAVNAALRRVAGQEKLQRLALANLGTDAAKEVAGQLRSQETLEKTVDLFMDSTVLLRGLKWTCCRSLQRLEFEGQIHAKNLKTILRNCHQLRSLVVPKLLSESFNGLPLTNFSKVPANPNLEVLDLQLISRFGAFLIKFPPTWPYTNLRTLRLARVHFSEDLDLSKCVKLAKLALHAISIGRLVPPPNLVAFSIKAETISAHLLASPRWTMALRQVHTLHLMGQAAISGLQLLIFFGGLRLSHLKHLYLSTHIYSSILKCPIIANGSFDSLESLAIVDALVTDDDVTTIGSLFPNLRYLDVRYAEVTGAFVSKLLNRPDNQIDRLVLSVSDHRSFRKEVKLANIVGVNISILNTSCRCGSKYYNTHDKLPWRVFTLPASCTVHSQKHVRCKVDQLEMLHI